MLTRKTTHACRAAAAIGLLLGILPARGHAAARKVEDQGTFRISVNGRSVGTENFTIHATQDQVEAKAQIDLSPEEGGKKVEFHTFPDLVLNEALQPQTYGWRQEGPHSSRLEIDFRPSPVAARYHTMDGKSDRREFELPKDVVVLDDNVLSHYEILVERYERTAHGAQTFSAFIPQEALPGRVTVEDAGHASIEIGGNKMKVRHYVVTTDLARIDLWADKEGRLQRISMPAAQLQADRQ